MANDIWHGWEVLVTGNWVWVCFGTSMNLHNSCYCPSYISVMIYISPRWWCCRNHIKQITAYLNCCYYLAAVVMNCGYQLNEWFRIVWLSLCFVSVDRQQVCNCNPVIWGSLKITWWLKNHILLFCSLIMLTAVSDSFGCAEYHSPWAAP